MNRQMIENFTSLELKLLEGRDLQQSHIYREPIPVVVLYPASAKVYEDMHRALFGIGDRKGKTQIFNLLTVFSSSTMCVP